MAKRSKLFKRVAIFLGVLLALFVTAAAVLPFLIDVDQFRPKIVEMAGQYINGEVKLGKLQLSLWGQIKVQVDGFSLSDTKGRNIVAVRDVYFHVPFSSLLAGSPLLTLAMKKPEVTIIKDKNGINALTLMKPAAPAAGGQAAASAAPTPGASSGGSSLPSMVTRARLGMKMEEAKVAYVDKTTDLAFTIDALNLRVKDLALSHPTEVEADANLDTRMGKVLAVKGPVLFRAKASPQFKGSEFEKASVVVKADLDKVSVKYGELFHKASGIPMNLEGTLSATPTSASIDKMVGRFHNAVLTVEGGVSGLGGEKAPDVRFVTSSNQIAMGPWAQLVPMLKEYELSGDAYFKASGNGPTDKLQYQADLGVKALKAKAPMLKVQPQIDASMHVVTDKVEKMEMAFRAPGNDLRMGGSILSFTKPKVSFEIASTGMDLDQLVDFPKPAKAAPGAPAGAPASAPATTAGPKTDFDAMLDGLRDNPMAVAAEGTIGFNLKFIKAMGVKIEPFEGHSSLRNLVAGLDRFRMGVFDGTIGMKGSFDLKPKMPRYSFAMDVAGLDLKKAVTSQMEMFKNTAYGKAFFKMKGQGASFNPDPAKANLEASGSFSIQEAQFASMDIGKMAADATNGALGGIAAKIPSLAGKKLVLGNVTTGYEKFSADFTIAKGIFNMPNFVALSGHHRGIDLKGKTTIALKDYKLAADWLLIDTYNVTKAKDLSVNIAGVQVNSILAEPNQPVQFPVQVGGTLFAPAPNYTLVVEALTKTALGNSARAGEAKLKTEATNKVKGELKKIAPPALQKVLDGFKF